MNRDKLVRTVNFINQNITVPGTPLSADNIFVDGMLPATPIKP
jgi:NitT/TauT family transport system substrate-binding protein